MLKRVDLGRVGVFCNQFPQFQGQIRVTSQSNHGEIGRIVPVVSICSL